MLPLIRDLFRTVRFRDPRNALSDLFARYVIARELGRGGMAVVYLARDRQLDRDVAIKVMHSTLSEDRSSVARLAREARIVAQLQHPNIVAIHDLQPLRDDSVALVMQYVRGRTLRQMIDAEGQLPIAFVEQVLEEVASALGAAHRRGIIHRDVKPENIYLEEETGRALLADFGIARSSRLEVGLTLHDEVLGTPYYMSPEQIAGGDLDARSDLYSLALVGYEMLTGKRPWSGEGLYQVLHKQQHEQLQPARASRIDLPVALENALDHALRKERLDRPETAEYFISLLRGEITVAPPNRCATRVVRAERPKAGNETSASEPTVRYKRPGTVDPEGGIPSTPPTSAPSLADGLPPETSPSGNPPSLAPVPAAATASQIPSEAAPVEVDPLIGLSQRLRIQSGPTNVTKGGLRRFSPRTRKAAGAAAAFGVAAILVAAIGRAGSSDATLQAASAPQPEEVAEQPAAPQPGGATAPASPPPPVAAQGGRGGSGSARFSNVARDHYRASGDITDIFCRPREEETVEMWRARVPSYCRLTP